jgi:hypothetical protein
LAQVRATRCRFSHRQEPLFRFLRSHLMRISKRQWTRALFVGLGVLILIA